MKKPMSMAMKRSWLFMAYRNGAKNLCSLISTSMKAMKMKMKKWQLKSEGVNSSSRKLFEEGEQGSSEEEGEEISVDIRWARVTYVVAASYQ